MKRPLAMLLLGAVSAFGQIDNPPTSTSILDATTVGRAVLTASNAAAARSAIEVELTNLASTPTLTALTNTGNTVLGTNSTNTVTVGGNLLVGGALAVTNAATTRTNLGLGYLGTNAATTRTNLGLGLPALTNTSNITAMRALAGSTNASQPFTGSFTFVDDVGDVGIVVISNGIIVELQFP